MATTVKGIKNFKFTSRKSILAVAVATAAGALGLRSAQAAPIYWTGGTSTLWSTNTNWSGNVTPTSANDVGFDSTQFAYSNQPSTDAAGDSVLGIFFGNAGGSASTGTTLGGAGTLTIGTDGITMYANTGTTTISAPIALGGIQTWTNNSANLLSVSGNISNGGNLLTVTGTGNTAISGILGNGAGGLTKSGTGTLTLTGSNTYTGLTTISNGTLAVGPGGSINSGTGSFNIGSTGTLNLSGGSITVTGNGAGSNLGSGFSGTINISSGTWTSTNADIQLSTNATWTQSGGTVTASMPDFLYINGAGASMTVSGGSLTMLGGHSIWLRGGTLTVSGSGLVDMTGALRLGGNGTAVLNLNGGTIGFAATDVVAGAQINFNGGTLRMRSSTSDFLSGFSPVTVKSGGAVLDTFGNSPTIPEALVHDATLGTTADGGLNLNDSAVTKGTLTLSGANTFTGDTILTAGTLKLANSLALQNSALNYNNQGGTITFGTLTSVTLGGLKGAQNLPAGSLTLLTLNNAANTNATYSGVLTNGTATLALTESGAGTQTLSGNNTYTGTTTISSGVLLLNNALAVQNSTVSIGATNGLAFGTSIGTFTLGGLSGSSNQALTATDASAVTLLVGNNNASTTYSGVLSSSGSLTKMGVGTLILAGANSFSGGTTVSSGTLQIGNAGTTGAIGTGNIVNNASLIYNRTDSNTITLASQTITGSGTLVATAGAGTIGVLGTINQGSVAFTSTFASSVQSIYGSTYGAAINLFANVTTTGNQTYNGVVSIGRGSLTTFATILTTTGGGSITLANGVVSGLAGYFSSGSLTLNTSTGNGAISLAGSPNGLEYGAGNLNINSGTGTTTLTGGNYYYDYSLLSSNVLLTGNTNFVGDGQRYVRGLQFGGSLTGTGTLTASLGNGGAASTTGTGTNGLVFSPSASATASVVIAGTAGLTKTGVGTLTLSGSNTYSGGTTLSAGGLNINNGGISTASAIGTGTFTISSGTLDNTSTGDITLATNNAQTWNGNFAFTGTHNLNLGTGTVTTGAGLTATINAGTLTVGGTFNGTGFQQAVAGAGTLNFTGALNTHLFINGGNVITSGGGSLSQFYIGNSATAGQTSTFTQTAGILSLGTGDNSFSNATASGTAIWNMQGGTATGGSGGNFYANNAGGTTTYNWSGGTVNWLSNGFLVAARGSSTMTLNGSNFNVANMVLGLWTGEVSTNVVNLNSGSTLSANYIGEVTTSGLTHGAEGAVSSTFNFNGGTLSPRSNASDYLQYVDTLNVQNGGAIIDTATFNITIPNSLKHITGATTDTLTKNGVGTLTLSGSNSYSAGTTITNGTLQAGNASALSTGNVTFGTSNTPTLDLNATNVTTGLLISSGTNGIVTNAAAGSGTATLTANGTGVQTFAGIIQDGATAHTAFNLSGGTQTLTNAETYTGGTTISGGTLQLGDITTNNGSVTGNIRDNAALVFANPNTQIYSGMISGSGTLTKLGAGKLTLSGSNTYGGSTTLSTGKLYVNGSIGGGAVSVAGGTTLGGTGTVGGTATVASGGIIEAGMGGTGKLTLGGLTLNGTDNINIGTLLGYASTTAIQVTGSGLLNPTGGANSVTINVADVSGTTVGNSYKLIGYSGSIGTSGFGAFQLSTLPARATGHLVNNTGEIDLTIDGTDFLIWTGTGTLANGWDTSTQNWKLNSNGSPTTYINSPNPDSVVFDDTATVGAPNIAVNINAATVTPSNVIFNNSTNYLLQGTFGIAGSTALTKNGTGTLTINTSNSYGGNTTLNAGTVIINNAAALGTGNLIIGTGSPTLDVSTGVTLPNTPQTWNGNFTFTGSNNLNMGTGAITLAANTQITVGNNTLTQGGIVSGNFSLTKSGGGKLVVTGNNAFTGGSTLTAGTLAVGNNNALGTGTLTITGGTLDANSAGLTLPNNPQAWNGDFTFAGTNNLNMGAGAIALAGNRQVTVTNGTLTVGGVISGVNLGLTSAGPGVLLLTGSSTYSGGTTVSGGILEIGDGATDGSIASSSGITDNSLLVFNVAASQSYGNVIIGTGNVIKNGGGTLTLGGTNTFNGGLTVSKGTLAIATINDAANNGTLGNNSIVTLGSNGNTGTLEYSGITASSTMPFTMAGGGAGAFQVDNAATNLTLSGAINGNTGSLIKTGLGTLTLANDESYTGVTTVSRGTLALPSGGSLTNSEIIVDNGNFNLTGGSIASSAGFLVGNLGGDVAIVNISSGNITLSGVDININVLTGTAKTAIWNQTGGAVTANTSNNVYIGLDSTAGSVAQFNISGGSFSTARETWLGVRQAASLTISGTASFTTAALRLVNAGGPAQGIVNLNGGMLTTGATDASNGGNIFNYNGGTLVLASTGSANFQNGFDTQTIKVGGAIINTNGNTDTFAQPLVHDATLGATPDGGLAKYGAGKLTLSASNTYTGVTTITAGTLALSGAGSISKSSKIIVGDSLADSAAKFDVSTVSGGYTLGTTQTLAGHGTIIGNVTTSSGSQFAPGNSVGTTTFNNNLTIASGTILNFEFNSTPPNDQMVVNGSLTLNGGGFNLYTDGTTNPWSAVGTYKLINYTGTIGGSNGIGALSVLNSQPGLGYTFTTGVDTNWIDLTIFNLHGSSSWNGGSSVNQNWSNTANWTSGIIPGVTDGTTVNTDTATFNAAPTVLNNGTGNPVQIDANRNLKNITFDSSTAGAYFVGTTGGPALLLTNGGAISTTSTVANTETVNAPLVLEGTSATYAFTSNASDNTKRLNIGGGITTGGTGGAVLTLNGSNTGANTVGGAVSNGAASLAIYKDGAGTWILNSANTYNGGTTINAGTLQAGVTGALSNVSVTFGTGSNPTLALADTGSQDFSGNTVDATNGGTITVSNTLDATIGDLTVGNNIGGSTFNLTSPDTSGNPYSLTTGILWIHDAQTINIANSANGGTGSLVVNGGLYDGLVDNYGATITKTGSGVLNLAADALDAYAALSTEQLIIAQGVVQANSPSALGDTTDPMLVVLSTGGTLSLGGATGTIRNVAGLADNGIAAGSVLLNGKTLQLGSGATYTANTFSGVIADGSTGGGGLIMNDGGNGDVQTLAGSNTYTGSTTITSGTLQNGVTNALPAGTDLHVNGGSSTYDLAGNSQTVNSLNGTGHVSNSTGGNAVFTVSNGGSFSGVITGSNLALNVTGGALALSGANTYSGGTTVAGGALLSVNNTSGSGTGSGAVHVAGTLTGSGTIHGLVTIQTGGHLAPGNGGVGTVTVDSLTLDSGSILDYEFNTNPAHDFTNVTTAGGLTISGGGFNLFQEGTATPFTTFGTYHLIGYNTSFTGSVGSLTVLNQQAGLMYTFVNDTALHDIDLTIASNDSSNFSITSPTITGGSGTLNLLLNLNTGTAGRGTVTVTNNGGTSGNYTLTSNSGNLSVTSGASGTVASGGSATATTVFSDTGLTYGSSVNGSLTLTGSVSGNTENVTIAGANVGRATVGANHTFGTPLTAYVLVGEQFTGLSSQTARDLLGAGTLGTTATILDSQALTGSATTVSEAWRTRTSTEAAQIPVLSDVLSITGIPDGLDYVMQMSYNPADLNADLFAHQTLLNLGELLNGNWTLAAANDIGGAQMRFLTSWSNSGAGLTVGDYGVDTTNHVVWAVLDHDAVFAVIPEPASLGLLGLGALGLLSRKRRSPG